MPGTFTEYRIRHSGHALLIARARTQYEHIAESSRARSLSHARKKTHPLARSLTHSLTHSRTHALTHSLRLLEAKVPGIEEVKKSRELMLLQVSILIGMRQVTSMCASESTRLTRLVHSCAPRSLVCWCVNLVH